MGLLIWVLMVAVAALFISRARRTELPGDEDTSMEDE